MVQYVLFRDGVQAEYKTSICSKATLLIFFINFLIVAVPFLIAYNTQGFWLKSYYYEEQPDVNFIYEYFILMETDDIEKPVICTTFESISAVTVEHNNCSVIKAREEDFNKDGKYDKLFFEVEGLLGKSNVYEVTVLLLFHYKLTSHSWFEMQSMGLIGVSSALGGGRVDITGDLRLHQRALLGHKGVDLKLNTSVISAKYPHDFSLPNVLLRYTERNVSTRIENLYSVWSRGKDPDEPFVFTLELNYPEEIVRYRPGTWQVVKMAWLQYLALFYLSALVGTKLKHFILDNRLVNNVRSYPWKKFI